MALGIVVNERNGIARRNMQPGRSELEVFDVHEEQGKDEDAYQAFAHTGVRARRPKGSDRPGDGMRTRRIPQRL